MDQLIQHRLDELQNYTPVRESCLSFLDKYIFILTIPNQVPVISICFCILKLSISHRTLPPIRSNSTTDFFEKVIRSTAFYIADALPTIPTKVLFAMINWLPTVLLVKRAAKFAATRLNDLSRLHIISYGYSFTSKVSRMATLNIDYPPKVIPIYTEYYFDRSFNFLIPSSANWFPDIISPSELHT